MITYQEEDLVDIQEELAPLLEDHYQEIAMYQEYIALDPDWEVYFVLEDMQRLHVFTARDNGILVGYIITFLNPHMHYKNDVYAVNDVIYLGPTYRHEGVAPDFISEFEKSIARFNPSVLTFHMKTFKPFESLMSGLGYDKAEYLFSKCIKE